MKLVLSSTYTNACDAIIIIKREMIFFDPPTTQFLYHCIIKYEKQTMLISLEIIII
jgi:hypothetical protein